MPSQVNAIRIAKGLAGYMKQQRSGHIVNIGSIWSVVSKEKRAVYSMTKNGIHGLTNALEKKTQRTPQREIDQAKRNMNDFIERNKSDEEES